MVIPLQSEIRSETLAKEQLRGFTVSTPGICYDSKQNANGRSDTWNARAPNVRRKWLQINLMDDSKPNKQ